MKLKQKEFAFVSPPAPIVKHKVIVVRGGIFRNDVDIHDINALIYPRGDGACDAYERDMAMKDIDDEDDY